MVNGSNQNAREAQAAKYQGGTIHLLSTAISDNGGSTELTTNSEASVDTADADWSLSSDNTTGTTTLENSADIDFGSPSGFTIDMIAVQATDNADHILLDDNPGGDTDLAGDGTFTLPAGSVTHTFGGE